MNYTVVGVYTDNEVFVDHIEADTPQAAARVMRAYFRPPRSPAG